MVITQREFHDFKVELNAVLSLVDERIKALEQAVAELKAESKPKGRGQKVASEGVDKVA